MRHVKGQEFWEAAKIVAAAAALILLAFGLVLGLGDEIAFPERQRITVPRDRAHSPAPADQATGAAAVPDGATRGTSGARRGQEGPQHE